MKELDAYLEEVEREGGFSGVIYVDRAGEVLCERAFGYANKADEVPNRIDTRFGVASVTKVFTAVAVAQLIEQGQVSLEGSVLDYRPDLTDTVTDEVKIRHLLSHTSGIYDYFDEEEPPCEDYADLWQEIPSYSRRTPSDFLPMFRGRRPYADPGGRFRYSNSGFIVLGLVIEAVTGNDFAEHVTEHVFRKAGMDDSGFFELDAVHPRIAVGYVPIESKGPAGEAGWRTNQFSIPARGGPDGGAFTTAPDLKRFFDAMMDGRLVSESARLEMWKPQARDDDTTSYGYGFWLGEDSGEVKMVGGIGEDPGASARAFRMVDSDGHIIVLSNHNMAAGGVFREVREVLG